MTGAIGTTAVIDRGRLVRLLERERERFLESHPRSHALFGDPNHRFGRVPMTWMNRAAGGFPLYLSAARGASVEDVDGHRYVDFV